MVYPTVHKTWPRGVSPGRGGGTLASSWLVGATGCPAPSSGRHHHGQVNIPTSPVGLWPAMRATSPAGDLAGLPIRTDCTPGRRPALDRVLGEGYRRPGRTARKLDQALDPGTGCGRLSQPGHITESDLSNHLLDLPHRIACPSRHRAFLTNSADRINPVARRPTALIVGYQPWEANVPRAQALDHSATLGASRSGTSGMVVGMATKKVTITIDENQLERIRALVKTGTTSSVSGSVQHAVAVALDDIAGWGAMLADALKDTGGELSREERRWADEVLGVKGRATSPAA